jgi:hypothetical protein
VRYLFLSRDRIGSVRDVTACPRRRQLSPKAGIALRRWCRPWAREDDGDWAPSFDRLPGAGRYSAVMIRRRVLPVGFVEPRIPILAAKPPSGPDWVHEIKHDGYRLMVRRDGDTVRLFTRRGHDWTDRYSAIAGAAANLRAKSFTMDGEAVVTGAEASRCSMRSTAAIRPRTRCCTPSGLPAGVRWGGTRRLYSPLACVRVMQIALDKSKLTESTPLGGIPPISSFADDRAAGAPRRRGDSITGRRGPRGQRL